MIVTRTYTVEEFENLIADALEYHELRLNFEYDESGHVEYISIIEEDG